MPVKQSDLAQDIIDSAAGRVTEVAKLIISDYRTYRDAMILGNQQNAANRTNIANAGAADELNRPVAGVPTPPIAPPTWVNGQGVPIFVPPLPGLKTKMDQVFKDNFAGTRRLVFEVQFNPSELSLNASALEIKKQSLTLNEGAGGANVSKDSSSAVINLNLNLIFDKMNEADAFLLETGTYGVAGVGTAAATAAAAAKAKFTGKHPFSVKPEVEALMATLRDQHTREVEFVWNDFSFVGQLQYLQVKYTLFSPLGHPVRAMVMVRMKREATVGDQWEKDFDTAFSGNGGQVQSLTQQHGMLNF